MGYLGRAVLAERTESAKALRQEKQEAHSKSTMAGAERDTGGCRHL